MQKVSIVLSTFNNIDDIKLNIDIYRHNFKNNYNLIVSANDDDIVPTISTLDVDAVVNGTNIPYKGSHPYARIHSRVYDSMKNGLNEALDYDSKYSIHNHADALILKEDSIINIISNMKEKNLKASVRGRGFGWYYKQSPIGMIDDHFFFIENNLLKEKKIFQQEAMELLPTRNNIHGILAMFILSNVGLKNISFHSDVNHLVSWDKRKINMLSNYMRPMSYDEELGFLHINSKSFLHNHDKALLAYYLQKNNLKKGNYIEYVLDTYTMDTHKLFKELEEIEEIQNKKLRRYFYDIDVLGRDFNVKDNLINNLSFKKFYKNIFNTIKKQLKDSLDCTHKYNKLIYKESMYNKSLEEYYQYHFSDLAQEIEYIKTNYIK